MIKQPAFWPCFAGLVILVIGLVAARKRLLAAAGVDKLVALGPTFFAASLGAFGAEHFVAAQFIVQAVPVWMPARLFWTYFVGTALIAASLSIVCMKYVRWSAASLAVMFFLFVLMIHMPRVAANPRDRISWAVMLRDLSFGGGALAFAGSQFVQQGKSGASRLIFAGRYCVAIPLIFFAAEHFLHPEFAPGVPLSKLTPAWVPLPLVWAYLTGAALLIAGICTFINKMSRATLTWLGLVITLLTLFLYLPIQVMAPAAQAMEGLNYVADTLLFAGAILLLAAAVAAEYPPGQPVPSSS